VNTSNTALCDAAALISAASGSPNGTAAGGAADSSSCSVQAAPGSVARAAAAALQVLVSHLDKAHGLRAQGMVAEVGVRPMNRKQMVQATNSLNPCMLEQYS
jgi:hypothetical protein